VGEHIDFMCDMAANTLPMVRSNQLKAYSVMSQKRWFGAPDVPTIDEMGLPGLYLSAWSGIWAPKGTPKEIVAKLNAAIVKALNDPAVKAQYVQLGQEMPGPERQTPEALAAFHKAEMDKWGPIVRDAHIKVE
jgi:tripartite-type tricarboxylate transporter receptor subunit TctC